MFDRTPNLAGAQIISYRATADLKWSVLIGITAGAPERYEVAELILVDPLVGDSCFHHTSSFIGTDISQGLGAD
jgi:hypothetical protein